MPSEFELIDYSCHDLFVSTVVDVAVVCVQRLGFGWSLADIVRYTNLLTYLLSYLGQYNKKLSYCWETVRRESMPRIAEMDVEMTT